MNKASNDMKLDLAAKGVDTHPTTCIVHIKATKKYGCVGISPQTSGGVHIYSKIKEVAKLVENMRSRNFPVFS